MSQVLQSQQISAPGFFGLNTQDASLDLASGYALVATNCVIDQYGRIGARKGWTKVNSALNADLSTNKIQAIGELVTVAGVSYTIMAGNNNLFVLSSSTIVTLTYGGGGVAPTITTNNWQMAAINGKISLYQTGYDPLQFDPAVSTTQYTRVSESTAYAGTVQQGNACIAAYGRIWNADVSTDKQTVQWSDVNTHNVFTGGTSGTLNTQTVWPRGGDVIVALGAHNGFLFIFGKNNILIYTGATTPSTMSLYDVITGIGCIARDSVAFTGSDLLFLSATGVRSVLRTVQEKSAPLREISLNVRSDLINYVAGETLADIKSVYSSNDGFYLLTLPITKIAYQFDMKATLPNGGARCTTWDSIEPASLFCKQDGTVYIGKSGYLATHTGYYDGTSTYRFAYYTNHTDLGQPSVTSILKRLETVVIGGSTQNVTIKWAYDFSGSFYSDQVAIPNQGNSEYGTAEYGANATTIAYYTAGVALQTLVAYASGSGKVVQTGYEMDINGSLLSIQKIEIHFKNGKLI